MRDGRMGVERMGLGMVGDDMAKTLIMAAPNGARKTKIDHPNLPISIEETVAEAKACFDQGAAMLHAHVRDEEGRHVLEAHRYKDLLALMADTCPDMPCQITTEAVGIYSPQDQAQCIFDTHPEYASLAIAELVGDQSEQALDYAVSVLRDAAAMGVIFQYILYTPDDLELLRRLTHHPKWPEQPIHVLFVLGKYNPDFRSHPDEMTPFLSRDLGFVRSWSICAFGPMEYDVMVKAAASGGHARVGFENNIFLKTGEIAPSTAALVGQLAKGISLMTDGLMTDGLMNGADARDLFG